MGCRRCGLLCAFSSAAGCLVVSVVLYQWPLEQNRSISLEAGFNGSIRNCDLPESPTEGLAMLDKQGFAVVPGFLSETQREWLLELHSGLPPDKFGHAGRNTGIKHPAYNGIEVFSSEHGSSLLSRVRTLLEAVQKVTPIHLTESVQGIAPSSGTFYHTNVSVKNTLMFPWHQDAETWWTVQEHFHTLKFYVFLEKPGPLAAGVDIVPFDVLRKWAPLLHDLSFAGGAASFFETPGPDPRWFRADNDRDSFRLLNFDLNRLACTPPVSAGDLLLLRGDVLHRTQPHNSSRTSFNTLLCPAWHDKAWSRMFRGGGYKFRFLRNARSFYVQMGVQLLTGELDSGAGASIAAVARHPMLALALDWYIRFGYVYRQTLVPMRRWISRQAEVPPLFDTWYAKFPL